MERKETITLLELSKRVGNQVACDELAQEYIDQMEIMNYSEKRLVQKVQKDSQALTNRDEVYVDSDANVYSWDESSIDPDGERIFKNAVTGEAVLEDDLLKFAELVDLDYLEDDILSEVLDGVFQWYLIEKSAAEYLTKYSEEIVTYVDKIDCYFWGITSFGTPWQGVEVDMTYDY